MMDTKKKVLVLGVGLQGKAVLHDLDRSPLVDEIVAGDLDLEAAKSYIAQAGLKKVRAVRLDASDDGQLRRVIRESGSQLVVCMLVPAFALSIARAAVDAGIAYTSSSYTGNLVEVDAEARAKGVTILPEMGMDPGIDLLLAQCALAELDEVHGLYSYGAGLPEPDCANNALKYKITWTIDGVLGAYNRPARYLLDGVEKRIPGTEMFRPENIRIADFPGLGPVEIYYNGDAVRYIEIFGLGKSVRTMGRFAFRYPGHSAFWSTMADLGFLNDEPTMVDGVPVPPRQFLAHHLAPRLQFEPHERDIVVVRIHTWGLKDGRKRDVVYDLIDYRDLESGLFAMNRTVGYTTSIAAQLILSGKITKPGVLSPVKDVPGRMVLEELKARGMHISRSVEDA